MKRAHVNPYTGWRATYLCRVCLTPYPVQVRPPARPRLPCSECGCHNYARTTAPKDDR